MRSKPSTRADHRLLVGRRTSDAGGAPGARPAPACEEFCDRQNRTLALLVRRRGVRKTPSRPTPSPPPHETPAGRRGSAPPRVRDNSEPRVSLGRVLDLRGRSAGPGCRCRTSAVEEPRERPRRQRGRAPRSSATSATPQHVPARPHALQMPSRGGAQNSNCRSARRLLVPATILRSGQDRATITESCLGRMRQVERTAAAAYPAREDHSLPPS